MMRMNCGSSDASTSTDDIRGRPLCLFYFTHPFGVLSPDPPTITTAPSNITQAFINMEPVSPYNFWSSTTTQESYNTSPTSSSKVSYDVGNVLIPKKPINLASVPKYTVDFNLHQESVSSSLFSSDIWLSTSSSDAMPRRIIPCSRILPPLALPKPNFTESSDEFWMGKSYVSGKVSLPPIEISNRRKTKRRKVSVDLFSDDSVKVEVHKSGKVGRVVGIKKARTRVKLSGVRRMVNCLMQRAIKGRKDLNSSPALQEVLNTIREAWTEPKSLLERCRALSRTLNARTSGRERVSNTDRDSTSTTMFKRPQLAELQSRPSASPGLMRRRYSMPETIMRKYRLAQQRSDSDDSIANTAPSRAASPASPSPPRGSCASLCEPPHRFIRRDRELMRKSALLRRLWARPNPCPSCCYCSGDLYDSQAECGRETRSLDGSRSELRHLSSSLTSSRYSKESQIVAGWATPKRQRLDSPNNFHGSDEMLRTAMRNSYDRAEELRHEREVHNEMSDSTFQSHDHNQLVSSNIATSSDTQFTDSSKSNNSRNTDESSDGFCSECVTAQVTSERPTSQETEVSSKENTNSDEPLYTESEHTITTSTVRETIEEVPLNNEMSRYRHINLQINEEVDDLENNEGTNVQVNKSSTESPYEILEIVVSETLNSSAFEEATKLAIQNSSPRKRNENHHNSPISKKDIHGIDLDEYVSNILVESLNSLTDQIENMNASIGSDRKISIVEKEIKVKLQNTGVNTIVHLSPTSNNQIIFGNAELYNKDDKDFCNNKQEHAVTIREEVESNNNYTSPSEPNRHQNEYSNGDVFTNENYEPIIPHESVNKAVLQQIQKLFQDEMQNIDLENYAPNSIPGISHIEISNVDVFVEENTNSQEITVTDDNNSHHEYNYHPDILSSVGSGNYYNEFDEPVLVPRFSALPHNESMEVNTSSSEDADIIGSECPSLVDSLDDPNSPRSILQRRTYHNRSELVRSAIDVLDLLPESMYGNESHPKEKSEAFFIRIKDDDCDCEKESIIVADHMPDKIKERLYRRHKKRELRMECAKRKKIKQYKRELEKLRTNEAGISKKEIEKECMSIVNALVNEVIAKIAQEEYKCMRIKQKSNNHKNTDLLTPQKKSTWKKEVDIFNKMNSFKLSSRARNENKDGQDRLKRSKERHQICGKLSLQTHPLITPDEQPKRIYQKSEIRDGNKCIEILEILEYVDSSQSSPETTNSDENLNYNRHRKSRIPVPISERVKKNGKPYKSSPILNCVDTYDNNFNDLNENEKNNDLTSQSHNRRASVPHETRSRSNSLRFKQVFDIIPEEKSSLSIESPSEDINYNRRVSAPNLSGNFVENNNNDSRLQFNGDISKEIERQDRKSSPKKDTKSIGTSPLSDISDIKAKSPENIKYNKNTITSPPKKSIATSPISSNKDAKPPINSAKKSLSSHGTRAGWLGFYKPNKQVLENEGLKDNKGSGKESSKDQDSDKQFDIEAQSTVRTIESAKAESIVIGKDKPRIRSEKTQSRESKSKVNKQKESKKKKAEKVKQETEIRDRKKVFKDCSLVRSLSDPQNDIVWKSDKRNVLSIDRSEEDSCPKSVKLPSAFKDKNPDLSTSESDSDSGKSLLCSLAPKWLSVGNMRQKRQVRKKASQDHQNQQSSAGGWSVTVAGNCYTALPADVEMRLSFPKTATNQITSQSDSGFGDESRAKRPIAASSKGCHCRHCDNCTCSYNGRGREEDNSYPPILPPAQKMTVTMKKESSGSSILTSKSMKKSSEPLPEVETFRSSRSKTKSSMKMQRGFSLHCWLPGDIPPPITNSNGLSVLGSAIIPEIKPRVPTMSERDLTRTYTPRHYLRS